MLKQLNGFSAFVASPKKILLLGHQSPDGDAIGSLLGFGGFLKKQGHEISMVVPDKFPSFLSFLQDSSEILVFEEKHALIAEILKTTDLVIALDFNSWKRLGSCGQIFETSSTFKMLIDHHQKPEIEADYIYWDTLASSTCQLVFDLIQEVWSLPHIEKTEAEALYTGIMTDTGSFKFPLTTAHTHETIAQLVKNGAVPSDIHTSVFDTNPVDRLKLIGYALSEKMKTLTDLGVAYMYLSLDELNRFNYQKGFTEGLVNYGLSIQGIRLACLITEGEDLIKMSFRSRGNIDVNEFARKYFDGGGHIHAAGGRSLLSLEETVEKFEASIATYISSMV